MKLYFKNGQCIIISKLEANIIRDNLIRKGISGFQIFERPDSGEPYKFINMEEVNCIIEDDE